MKLIYPNSILVIITLTSLFGFVSCAQQLPPGATKIPIDPQRWSVPTNSPDGIQALFDGVTDVNVEPGYGQAVDVVDSFYPLLPGEALTLESIRLFDGWGSNETNPMTLSIITDTWQRVPVATFTGAGYGWIGPYPQRPTVLVLDTPVRNARYLVLTSAWPYPTEMELYGAYTAPNPVSVPSAAGLASQKQTKLKNLLGVNAFEWDLEDPRLPSQVEQGRLNAVKNFTGIRHYFDWEKLESTRGQYTFNPTPSGGWNFDVMYKRLQQEGIEVLTCMKTQPGWMQATYPAAERDAENVPVLYGRDFAAPASYVEQAKAAFQFAARYGSNTAIDPALLAGVVTGVVYPTAPSAGFRTREIGLNLVKYLECDNERDKWWKGRKAYQTAPEYAANLSAFYDGHLNTLGPGVGVKNADPAMQVVMGGLASPNPAYVQSMVDWCRQYRGYRPDGSVNLCWDVINYHFYSNDGKSSQGGVSTRGAAPEVSEAGKAAQAFVLMAHQQANDMPVWITETGYDLHQGSPFKAVAVGGRTVEETQADWTLRTALAYARWGVARAFFYQLYDDNPASPIQFGSMGLTNADRSPRLAAQYLSQANRLLGGFTYKETLSANPVVDRYELNGQSAYALVVPDERGRTASYTLHLGNASYADVYRPTAGSPTMTVQRIQLASGQLTVQVSETPLFVLAVTAPLPVTLVSFTALSRGATAVQLDWKTATDSNSAHFNVERSLDGKTFARIGQVTAAGTSTAAQVYALRDAALPAGARHLYYRLEQVDRDGQSHYSLVVRVTLTGAVTELSLSPNPMHRTSTLRGAKATTLVQVFDALGRLICTTTTDASGTVPLTLPDQVLPGVYVVRTDNHVARLIIE